MVEIERRYKLRNDGTLGVFGSSLIVSVQTISDCLLKDKVAWVAEGTFSSTTADIESPRLTKNVFLLVTTTVLFLMFQDFAEGIHDFQTVILFITNIQQGAGGRGFRRYIATLRLLWSTYAVFVGTAADEQIFHWSCRLGRFKEIDRMTPLYLAIGWITTSLEYKGRETNLEFVGMLGHQDLHWLDVVVLCPE
jgi:hypothetical protein